MAYTPLVNARVTITARDINNNNIAKTFTQVLAINFDYAKGMVNVVDVTGSFFFPLTPMTTLTYVIVPNPGGQHTIVAS